MFELEDYSSGFHDGFLNKYADSSGPILDFYISDSLQDMLDIDIRSEVATLVGGSNELASLVNDMPSSFDHVDSISNDIANLASSSNHAPSWLGGPTWSSSNDFYADVGACVNPISVMPLISSSMLHRSPKTTLNTNGLRNTTSPPGSPVENKSHLHFSPKQLRIAAIKPEQKYIHNSSSTSTSQASNIILQRKNVAIESIKKDLSQELRRSPTSLINNVVSSTSSTNTSSAVSQSRTTSTATLSSNSLSSSASSSLSSQTASTLTTPLSASSSSSSVSNGIINSNGILSSGTNTIKLAPGIGGLTFANSVTYNKLKQQSTTTKTSSGTLTANGTTIVLKRDRDSSPLHNMATLNGSTSYHHGNQISAKILGRNVIHTKNISPATHMHSNSSASGGVASPLAGAHAPTISNVKPSHKLKAPVDSGYPKPAYSYSCLIAMALKNSRSGSLPVSEIYSFMCEHFPYFKTARSGWKNSVRHNLSMSKCFEKVEKPTTNGGQRKGCLWAMNPHKIAKMDEEVQKWSRKDPMAIRNAMVFPDNLEALERGEMKHGSTGDSDVELDSQSEVEETSDSEELDQELDETIVETHEMYVEEDDDSGPQQHRDFDIEVEDIYDAIDMEDDKDAVRLAINSGDIIEMTSSPASSTDTDYHSPKRARLNVNYSIGPAGDLHQQFKQHTQQQIHQQHHQQQQQHSQLLTTPTTAFQSQNRRKMQLVNRIA